MLAIFSLIKNDTVFAVEDAICDFQPPLGGQAVHEATILTGCGQQAVVDLVIGEDLFAFFGFGLLSHTGPDIGVNHSRIRNRFTGIGFQFELNVGKLLFQCVDEF